MAFATHSFAREFTVAAHFFAREIAADRSKSLAVAAQSFKLLRSHLAAIVRSCPGFRHGESRWLPNLVSKIQERTLVCAVGENADGRSRFADRGTRGSKSNRSCVISNSVSTHHEMLARQINDRVKKRSEVFLIVVLLVKINSWPQLHLPSKKVMLLLHPLDRETLVNFQLVGSYEPTLVNFMAVKANFGEIFVHVMLRQEARENSLDDAFYSYIKNHNKCTRGLIQRKMQKCLASLVEVLHRGAVE
ncbi:unnamed protein product [Linum trigynum]|uniref:Uncharacterized protein n=1 Tax=Linum trigynum TaxID=586398 RepID=A0AAV2DXD3_9ROSI